jgi:dual specificity phosphatase 12
VLLATGPSCLIQLWSCLPEWQRKTDSALDGDGSAPPMDKMAKYPATPTASNPPTPMGGHGRRKIRCKMCRRHLAVREHMMDHILDQSPVSRPRTPSNFALPSPRFSFSAGSNPMANSGSGAGAELSGGGGRRPSIVSDVINPLTGLPGRRSRHDSLSSSGVLSPPPQPDSAVSNGILQNNDTASLSKSQAQARLRSSSDALRITPTTQDKFTSSPMTMSRAESPDTRQLQTADQLASRLPPHLLALRMAGSGMTGLSSPMESSPGSSPERETYVSPAHTTFPPSSSSSGGAGTGSGANLSRRLSVLAMTPADQPRSRRGSALTGGANANDISGIPDIGGGGGPPILVNPKCSGYFVEPLTWMEPVLKNGDISGKLVCPNEKCGVKIGNFDWAGVQCGCKEWVTPVSLGAEWIDQVPCNAAETGYNRCGWCHHHCCHWAALRIVNVGSRSALTWPCSRASASPEARSTRCGE